MTDTTDSKEKPAETPAPKPAPLVRAPLRGEISRRGVLFTAWAAFGVATAGMVGAMTRFLFPNVLYEPPQEFKAGFPPDFAVDAVDERFKAAGGITGVPTVPILSDNSPASPM